MDDSNLSEEDSSNNYIKTAISRRLNNPGCDMIPDPLLSFQSNEFKT